MTVLAFMSVFIEKIFLHFVSEKFSVLIFNAFDIRIIHKLRIKAYSFERTFCDAYPSFETSYPADDIISRAFDAWREPAFFSCGYILLPFFKARLAVSCFSCTSASARALLSLLVFMDYIAAMFDLHIQHYFVCLVANYSYSCMF